MEYLKDLPFNQDLTSNLPFIEEEGVNDEWNQAVPVALILTERVVNDVTSDHEGLGVVSLADVGKLTRGMLFVLPLDKFYDQVLDLELDLLRRLQPVVVLKVKSDNVVDIYRCPSVN